MLRFDLSDAELDKLWALQRDATVMLSLSAACTCLSFGLWLQTMAEVAEEDSHAGNAFVVDVGMPLFALLAVLFAGLGFFALKRRREVLAEIDERRRTLEGPILRLEDSPEPGIVAGAREPSRTLLRW